MTRTVATSHKVIYLVLTFFIRTAESERIPIMVPVAKKKLYKIVTFERVLLICLVNLPRHAKSNKLS